MAGSLLADTMNRLAARVAPAIGSAVGEYAGSAATKAVTPLIKRAASNVGPVMAGAEGSPYAWTKPGTGRKINQAIAELSPEKIGSYTEKAARVGSELATNMAKDYIINQQNPPQISRSQQQHYNRLFMASLPPGYAYENAEPIMYPTRQAIPSWLPGALGVAGVGAAAMMAGRR